MKTLERYQCEHCQTIYESEDEAKRCESTHITDAEIVGGRYTERDSYPWKILLKFADGKKVSYKCPEIISD